MGNLIELILVLMASVFSLGLVKADFKIIAFLVHVKAVAVSVFGLELVFDEVFESREAFILNCSGEFMPLVEVDYLGVRLRCEERVAL